MKLFGSKTRMALLSLLLLTRFSGSIRAVSREIGISPAYVRKELENLKKAGILKKEKVASATIYSMNEKCPFLDELKALIVKVSGADILLRQELTGIKSIQCAFIFGSYASGRMDEHSDIDLFIVGRPDMKKLATVISKMEKKLGREISFFVYSPEEFRHKKDSAFIKNILSNKIIPLVGDADELIRA